MNCTDVRESLEMYIGGDLPVDTSSEIAEHLRECTDCAVEYERVRLLVGELKGLREAFAPRESFSVAAAAPRPSSAGRGWKLGFAVAIVLAAVPTTALAVPSIARRIPVLPINREVHELRADVERLERVNERLQSEVASLTIQLREIDGEQVPVVGSAESELSPEVEYAVQKLAMDFVRAQYARDADALAAMGTDKLRADLEANPDMYLREGGDFVFAQMTNVGVTEDGVYLVFIRLMDNADFSESQYQEDFEIIRVGDEYLVDFCGMDA